MFHYPGAAASAVIAAPLEDVWALVSDVTRHPVLAGSGEVKGVTIVGGGPLAPGSVFQAEQCMRGITYVTANKVMTWDPPYHFAWKVGIPGMPGLAQTWVFNLAPVAGGTRVENGVVLLYALPNLPPFTWLSQRMVRGYDQAIAPTLSNIARLLDAPPPTDVTLSTLPPPAALAHMPPPLVPGIALTVGGIIGIALLRRVLGALRG
jgi:hypothetical protein